MSNLHPNLKRKLKVMSETCLDCHEQFVLTSSERARFEALSGQLQGFKMPRRCTRCRRNRRNLKPTTEPASPAMVPMIQMKGASTLDRYTRVNDPPDAPPAPPASSVQTAWPKSNPKVEFKEQNEVNIVLGTGDFEALVSGKPVTWHGVQVVLADIGFPAMYDALDRAAVVRATAQVVQPRK